MRVLTAFAAIAPLVLAAPDVLGAFEPADLALTSVDNSTAADIFKRQGDNCADGYYACSNLNAPGLCCPRTAICSADRAQNVGCCPQGIACTGTLGQASATGGSGAATTTAPFAPATTTTTGSSFEQTPADAPSSAAPSTVTNAFFPFPYIATTYTNAAACSRAYERCQDDTARCTAALASGGGGVTVQAPGGQGATITPVPSLGPQSAASVCQSLSSQACYGLKVEACQAFGGDSAARQRACVGGAAGKVYVVGAAGVAVGLAGGLL